MKSSRRLCALITLFTCLTPVAAQQPKREPLRIADALSALSFTIYQHVTLSPDGEWVAYSASDVRRRETSQDKRYSLYSRSGVHSAFIGSDVWVTNTRSGESKNLTEGKASNWGPVWSPDGKYLAFYSDRGGAAGVWLWEKASGALRQASNVIFQAAFLGDNCVWTLDSRKLIVNALPEGMTVEDALDVQQGTKPQPKAEANGNKSTVVVFNSPAASGDEKGPGKLRDGSSGINLQSVPLDLAVIDVATGKTERIAHNVLPTQTQLSPDGKLIAFLDRKGLDTSTGFFFAFDLTVVSLQDKAAPRVIAPGVRQARMSWSPDGTKLSYTVAEGDCYLVSAAGGAPRNLTTSKHPSFSEEFGFRSPLWDGQGQTLYLIANDALWRVSVADGKTEEVGRVPNRKTLGIVGPACGGRFWSPDQGRSALLVTRDDLTKQVGYYQLELATGKSKKLIEESKDYGLILDYNIDVTQDGQRVVYIAQDAQHDEDVWIADKEFRSPKRLSRINPQLDGYAYGQTQIVDYHSIDGEPLRGALLLPAGYQKGERYPMVVYLYGGSLLSNKVFQFGLAGSGTSNMQLYAARGYAVLLPDTPLKVGTPMQDLLKTVMPAIDKAVEMGVADSNRIGVMGHSYGGYSTLALIVQTTRFKAAISSAGPANLINSYGQMDKDGFSIDIGWAETSQGRMGGHPWQFRDRFIENSPVFYLDRVQTPLLIVQGEADSRVPARLADEVYVGLRRLGKEVSYAKYLGEDHSPLYWGYANMVDYCQRTIDWFDQKLGTAKPGVTGQ